MKVVVSGAKGFIGSHLISALSPEFEFVGLEIDDFNNPEMIEKSFRHADVFIHLAGLSSIAECERDVHTAYKVNVALTGYLVDTFYKQNPKGKVIFSSTGQVYDDQKSAPYSEDSLVNPANVYARTKLVAEDVLKNITLNYKAKYTVLRFFNIAHKSQRPTFFLSSVYKQIMDSNDNKVDILVGNVDLERDFSSIQDVLRVFRHCLQNLNSDNFSNKTINVCSGVPKSLRKIVQVMSTKLKKEVTLISDPERVRANEATSIFGHSKVLSELNLIKDGQSIDAFVDAFLQDPNLAFDKE